MSFRRALSKLLIVGSCTAPAVLWAHEGFLPLHEHSEHRHAHDDHAPVPHTHGELDGKAHKHVHVEHEPEKRWAIATGVRYTKYDAALRGGSLWEAGLGADYAILPWLHLGGEVSYGWYDGPGGKVDGWLTPSVHLDVHVPISDSFEMIAGLEVGLPLSDEELTGQHWEWVPHVELRYDTEKWYAAAGVALAFSDGAHHHAGHDESNAPAEEDHDHEEDGAEHEHEDDHDAHEASAGPTEVHEIVDPHGERELQYHAALGFRMLDENLTAEARFSGVRVLSDNTDARNYLRGGLRLTWRASDTVSFSTEGNIPIGAPERNDWQASAAVRVRF